MVDLPNIMEPVVSSAPSPAVPPSFEVVLPHHIDSTMLTAFRACPQKYFLEFVRGVRPREKSIDLHAGGCFAKALEVVYRLAHRGYPIYTALGQAELVFHQMWGDFVILDERNPKQPDRVWEAILDYVRVYGVLTDRVQPYRVNGEPTYEYSFAIPLDFPGFPKHPVTGDPFIFCGRFDMLGEFNGVPIVRDEKTSKAAGDKWADQWDLRGQFIGYLWACNLLGIPVDTVCIRGVIIQKTQIRQLEAIRPFSKNLRDRWFIQLREDLHRLVNAYEAGYWDYNFGDSCHSYSGCMFKLFCETGEPDNWLSNFVENRWNPLLLDPLDESLLLPELIIK